MTHLTKKAVSVTIAFMKHTFTYTITQEDAGRTVHEFLRMHGYSVHILASMKPDREAVRLNGEHVFMSCRMKEGDVLTTVLGDEAPSRNIVPAPVPFEMAYEDDDLMVVNKPAGISIHPAINHPADTLANGVAWYFMQKGEPHVFRCINRLDRDTTGLLILAKHRLSAAILESALRRHEIRRTYLAIAEGDLPPEGVIDLPIGRKEGSLIERCIDMEHGDRAVTHFRTVCRQPYRFDGGPAEDGAEKLISVAELRLETGRTHQIRVHMKAAGHPLLGDTLYNADGLPGMSRQALHSWKLDFVHPISGRQMHFEAPVPKDMCSFLPACFRGGETE